MLLGYGAKVGLGNMRVKAENRMVTTLQLISYKRKKSAIRTKYTFPKVKAIMKILYQF